jgi:hypothetical protein
MKQLKDAGHSDERMERKLAKEREEAELAQAIALS